MGSIRSYVLVGQGVSLEVTCVYIFFVDQDISSQLLLKHHVCLLDLLAGMVPTMMVMDSDLLNYTLQ